MGMTVKEFAAFTSMSASKIRSEIRDKKLMATMIEKGKNAEGKTVPQHYEITEDPAAWLKRRNPSQEQQENQEQQTESQQSRQQSQQEQESQESTVSPLAVLGWMALGLGVLGLGALFVGSLRSY